MHWLFIVQNVPTANEPTAKKRYDAHYIALPINSGPHH